MDPSCLTNLLKAKYDSEQRKISNGPSITAAEWEGRHGSEDSEGQLAGFHLVGEAWMASMHRGQESQRQVLKCPEAQTERKGHQNDLCWLKGLCQMMVRSLWFSSPTQRQGTSPWPSFHLPKSPPTTPVFFIPYPLLPTPRFQWARWTPDFPLPFLNFLITPTWRDQLLVKSTHGVF